MKMSWSPESHFRNENEMSSAGWGPKMTLQNESGITYFHFHFAENHFPEWYCHFHCGNDFAMTHILISIVENDFSMIRNDFPQAICLGKVISGQYKVISTMKIKI